MAQPRLANATIKPLLTIGPIGGLDASTDPYYVDGLYATDMLNIVPNRTYGSYSVMRGRLTNPAAYLGYTTWLALSQFYQTDTQQFPTLVALTQNVGTGVFQYQLPWENFVHPISVPHAPGQVTSTGFGQFASYLKWLFFSNGDPYAQCYKFDSNLNATFWQIAPPTGQPGHSISSPTNGQIYGQGYYWRYTYGNDDLESSPSPPFGPQDLGLILGPPGSGSAQETQNAAPGLAATLGTGTIPAGFYYGYVTFVNGAGVESGVSVGATVNLSAPGEITFTPPPTPVGAVTYNTYLGTGSGPHLQTTGTAVGTPVTVTTYNVLSQAPPPFIGTIIPPQPVITATNGGGLPQRTEYYVTTYVDASGESLPSPEASINLQAGQIAIVQSPPAAGDATGYNVYGSLTSTQEVKQTASPIAIGTNWTEPITGLTLGQEMTLTAQGSTDPQTTVVNFYRIGGALGQWLFVGKVANNPNGTVTFVDNTADANVTGQPLELHRDPPAPFNSICEHKERMWGFGYPAYQDFAGTNHPAAPSDLWYSNYVEPWGFDNTNQVFQLGAHDTGDTGVGIKSLSSVLIAWKTKTMWAVYGDSPSDFFPVKLYDVGAASQRSIVVAFGVAFWLSNQGVYMFDGTNLTYISKDVKKILDGMSQADFAASAGFFSDRMYGLSFPTQGISLLYDTVGGKWWKSNMSAPIFAYDPEGQSRPTAPDFVYGGAVFLGNTLQVEQWFASYMDRSEPIGSFLSSKYASTGAENATIRCRFFELIASSLSPTDEVALTVTANPGFSSPPPFTQGFAASAIPRQLCSLPPGLDGQEVQLAIATSTSEEFVLQGASVHGWARRAYNVFG